MIGKAIQMAALAVTGLALIGAAAHAQGTSIYDATLMEKGLKTEEVSTQQVRQVLKDHSALIIDSRTHAEYVAGHIPGAQVLDGPASGQVAAVEKIAGGDKTKAIVLYCNGPFCRASKRLGDNLASAGFSNVRRYQLGIPIWRALGGPTEIDLAGISRIYKVDLTAVFIDARSSDDFAKGSISGALNLPAEEAASGKRKKLPLPLDDFNRRIVLFGSDAGQARKLADYLSKRPWHNVAYYAGSFETLKTSLKSK
jgi:rhodanese-related sulfurtransferase